MDAIERYYVPDFMPDSDTPHRIARNIAICDGTQSRMSAYLSCAAMPAIWIFHSSCSERAARAQEAFGVNLRVNLFLFLFLSHSRILLLRL